ncbi:hypothetical protein [Streptomyces sp. NPDC055299]
MEVLAEVMRIDLIDLELSPGSPPISFAGPDGVWIAIQDSLSPTEREHRVRELLTARLIQDSDLPDRRSPRCRKLNITALYAYSQWGPRDGWRSDEEVIVSLRSLIAHVLDGAPEDFPDDAYPLPDGVGAVIAFGYDEVGRRRPLVWVDSRLPRGLCADLWGFCAALIGVGDESEERADEDGTLYVSKRRQPVTGPGPELLGALTVQRFGRRPGDCAFPMVTPPDVD